MYFAEQNQDADVGYMAYVNGNKTGTVMDAEAVDIFWSYIDNEWYGDKSTDDLFVTVYNKTANRIMSKSTTGLDVAKWFIILLCIIAAGVIAIVVIKRIREHARKSAEETAQILNAGKNQQTFSEAEAEELADKWTNSDTPDN